MSLQSLLDECMFERCQKTGIKKLTYEEASAKGWEGVLLSLSIFKEGTNFSEAFCNMGLPIDDEKQSLYKYLYCTVNQTEQECLVNVALYTK